MDDCLQQILPEITKILSLEYIEGECCISYRSENYLTDRAALHFSYSNYSEQTINLIYSMQCKHIPDKYLLATRSIIVLLHDNLSIFNPDTYNNIYVLFGFYCTLHLSNSKEKRDTNLIIYIDLKPQPSTWSSFCKWSGMNNARKYMGYNNYLSNEQY